MSSSIAIFRPDRSVSLSAPADVRERSVRRRVAVAWGLLVLNVLTFSPGGTVIPIPSLIGKGITQAALPLALLLALSVNRRVIVRPNVFLCLVTLLVLETFVTILYVQALRSTAYRTFRLTEFVATLWVLSPWWGRRDLLLVRSHLIAMSVVLGSVVLGALVAPSRALHGRLEGTIWPIPSTQVAHYAAVTFGLVVVLWLCGFMRGRVPLLVLVVAGTILIMTHTRTALVALITGILVAGLSLIAAKARVRKFFATAVVVASIATLTLSSFITNWLARGEGTQQLENLTGRTAVWGPLLAFPRDKFQEFFGFGLSGASFDGLPIDSNWLASYQEQGLFGVIVCAAILLFLVVTAYFRPRGVQRALALFLVTYCLLASFTEVAFTDASAYLLDLTVAASLLVPSVASGGADMRIWAVQITGQNRDQ